MRVRRARTTWESFHCQKRATNKTPAEVMATQNANESPRHPRRFSLVHQASCETLLHAGVRRQNTQKHREQLREITRGEQILQQLNDEGVELIWAADKGSIAFTAVLSSSGEFQLIASGLACQT
ncbi:hypothetical protein ANCCAN_15701 [Ancylostoma caninum]|uniref:Uncharacterized protein n=1 Tax=Ancylostoma caninum TaxID=29170 RepID=A0A368G5X0_ANCCA|nr:hypothetical protein ANCCAN_15701 [Ancylostoma caninum]